MNPDLLYAPHMTLLTRVTPQEWEALGHGSCVQKKVTQAYEKRCKRMGGRCFLTYYFLAPLWGPRVILSI